jgi:hypothetical protein
MNWDTKEDRWWAWILIEMDLREGMAGDMDMVYKYYKWNKKNRLLEDSFPMFCLS